MMETTKPSYRERKKHMDEQNKITSERIEATPVIKDILSYLDGIKYRRPQDENERGYNRGIERAQEMIRSDFYYWPDM